ncbi:MAG: transcriptional regulator [Bdellovibrio sp.]
MNPLIPRPDWTDLKRELTERWREQKSRSMMDTFEQKVGAVFEEVSEKLSEMTSRYHLYEEPHETEAEVSKEESERVLELSPPKFPQDEKPSKYESISN